MRRLLFSSILTAGLVFSPTVLAQQQQSSDPYAPPPPPPKPPTAQADKGCSAQATKGSTGGWKTSSTCPPPAQNPNQDAPKLTTEQSGNQQQPKKSTADDNPFPQDVSQKAADAAKAREAQEGKQSPSAAQGESSSSDKTKGLDLEGDKDGRLANGAGGIIHDPQLAEHDVHVGEFYLNREDYQGAYERLKEATQADPANADAVFYLAEAARHLNHKNEAIQNYQLYLAALPDGPKSKAAHKALRELSSKR
jgi:tetratricopeptide (TPR) repeat protein